MRHDENILSFFLTLFLVQKLAYSFFYLPKCLAALRSFHKTLHIVATLKERVEFSTCFPLQLAYLQLAEADIKRKRRGGQTQSFLNNLGGLFGAQKRRRVNVIYFELFYLLQCFADLFPP